MHPFCIFSVPTLFHTWLLMVNVQNPKLTPLEVLALLLLASPLELTLQKLLELLELGERSHQLLAEQLAHNLYFILEDFCTYFYQIL